MASLLVHYAISPTNTRQQSSFSKQNTLSTNINYTPNPPSKRKPLISVSASDQQVSVSDPSPPSFFDLPDPIKEIKSATLKYKLLSVISGLNRGLAASEEDLRKADSVAKEIETVGGTVDLEADVEKLQGKWKLIYSSAFSTRSGSLIGRLLPLTLGQVFQRIDTLSKDFDNIVELQLGTPWPLEPVELTATLAYKFEIIGSSTFRIKFEKTTVKAIGNLSQLPPLDIPQLPEQLRPSTSNSGSGDFDVTYLDSDIQITRGDRGELRVYVVA